jgi:hypothetical protein
LVFSESHSIYTTVKKEQHRPFQREYFYTVKHAGNLKEDDFENPDYIVKVRKQPGAIIPNNALLDEINELLKHTME